MKGSKAERRAYASEMLVQGGMALYKVNIVRQGVRRWRAHIKTAATKEPAAGHLTCNQAPAYIRGPGPLD
jgi:hypothetical protein